MNKDDISIAGLKEGQIVDLISHFEGEERIARHCVVVPYDIPRRSAATYFPEANVLVPVRSVADKSNTPASKSVIISIRVSEPGSAAQEVQGETRAEVSMASIPGAERRT